MAFEFAHAAYTRNVEQERDEIVQWSRESKRYQMINAGQKC